MIVKGQKRKFPPEDEDVSDGSSPNWESQRQFVFSVSLSKYQRGQELPEPSLRRSVLIANTLRQVSQETGQVPTEEMEVESCCSSPLLQESVQESTVSEVTPATHHSVEEVSNSDSAVSTGPAVSSFSSSNRAGDEDEDWGSMTTDGDFSLSAAISSILTVLDTNMDGSAQAAQRAPLRSLENLQRPSEGSAAWVKQSIRGYGGSWEPRESNVDVMRCSYLSELAVEDLFQDIDTSLLDRELGVLGLRGSGGYPGGDDLPRYLLPFSSHSSAFNQNLKCLPSFSSFSPIPSSPSSPLPLLSSPSSSLFSGQNQGLELDSLMEILVES